MIFEKMNFNLKWVYVALLFRHAFEFCLRYTLFFPFVLLFFCCFT